MCPPIIGALFAPTAAAGAAAGAAGGAALAAGQAGALAATTATASTSVFNALTLKGLGQAFSLVNSIAQQQEARRVAQENNRNAFLARLNADRSEKLRIRQVRRREQAKLYQNAIAGRQARATARTAAENIGGGVLDRLVNDYLRQEGNYNNSILSNLEAETAQSRTNFEAIALNQQARQVYVPKVDYATTFASAAFAFGQDYLDYEASQQQKRLEEEIANQNRQILSQIG
jgi:hypothetical protein